MIAAFNSIVLLSALPEKVFKEQKDHILDKGNSDYKKVSFGLWVGLYSRLAKMYRKMNDDFYPSIPFEKKFYASITTKNIINILDKIPKKRNETTGHGGSISEIVVQKTISELTPNLDKMFGVLTAYKTLELIYTQSMKKNNGLYRVHIKRLEGTHYPFKEDAVSWHNVAKQADSN